MEEAAIDLPELPIIGANETALLTARNPNQRPDSFAAGPGCPHLEVQLEAQLYLTA